MDLETLESLSEHDEHRNGTSWHESPAAIADPSDEGDETASADGDGEPAAESEGLDGVVESLLLASGGPVPLARLVEALDGPSKREVSAALAVLAARYEREGRGLRVVEVAGGFQLRTAPQHGPWVRRLLGGRPPRLSRPMLETLAIIAYRQPCTRPEIEAVRGVDCDAVVSTLLERRLIRMLGRKDAPGRPLLYGTTREFLEVFGLPDLRALPPLRDLGDGIELLMGQDLQVGPEGVRPAADAAATSDDESQHAPHQEPHETPHEASDEAPDGAPHAPRESAPEPPHGSSGDELETEAERYGE
jgi:segregation and condensation protein B